MTTCTDGNHEASSTTALRVIASSQTRLDNGVDVAIVDHAEPLLFIALAHTFSGFGCARRFMSGGSLLCRHIFHTSGSGPKHVLEAYFDFLAPIEEKVDISA